MKKNFFKTYEFLLICMVVGVFLAVGLVNNAFWSVGTIFDAIRIQEVFLVLGLGLLPIVILGGVDISYVALAAFTSYPVHLILSLTPYKGGIWLYYLIAALIGLVFGLGEGYIIDKFKLSIFDTSLAVNTMLYGLLTFATGGFVRYDMDSTGLSGWNMNFVYEVDSVVGTSGVHVSMVWIVVMAILLHLFLEYTTLGRGIYAIGSDKSVAIRTGFNLRRIYMAVFAIMGLFSGIGGATFSGLARSFSPIMLMGKNMIVLSAVVLGGASTTGGRGSVLGVILGTVLIGFINQSLVYIGVPTIWYDAVIGTMFMVYAAFQTGTSKAREN